MEVVQFDFLTPEAVAAYCQERGFLQCLWECGGKLAAPAIAGGAIHKAMAFIAPKIVSPSSIAFTLPLMNPSPDSSEIIPVLEAIALFLGSGDNDLEVTVAAGNADNVKDVESERSRGPCSGCVFLLPIQE